MRTCRARRPYPVTQMNERRPELDLEEGEGAVRVKE
jgi:hypothetical protein